jgi:2-oxoglutarate/2-oxoacid ferredoxin oxidoreductase subunit alpha
MYKSVTWKIGGEAGFGIMSSGTMLSRTFARHGYHTLATNEYPSLIRGGHNLITVRIATSPFAALNKDIHILAALNKQTVELHKDELTDNAIILFDPQDFEWKAEHFTKPVRLVPIPLKDMIKDQSADPVMRNTVLLGATVALLNGEFAWLEEVITDIFKKKGEHVISFNVALAKTGYDHVLNSIQKEDRYELEPAEKKEDQLVINASEALGLGAVKAGMKFAAIYPMTPINAVITFLADHAKQLGIVYKQPEDEISGINMAIGASYAGVRSMVATSGGGFALMVEGLSLAGIMELPVVIDMGMRAGPATGMPTWTEQGELRFVIHAGHGEFPRIVFAPGSCEECYSLTIQAFHFADKYQIPVFVLTDKYLNESQWCVPKSVFTKPVAIDRGKFVKPEELKEGTPFKRYQLGSVDGVSPRIVAGTKNGQYFCNSYEHDETGMVTEDPKLRVEMATKRLNKFKAIEKDIFAPVVYGDDKPELTLVTWGSTTGPVLEAMKTLQGKGKKVRVVQYQWMYPFPAAQTKELLTNAGRVVDIEQNSTAQLTSLIAEFAQIEIKDTVLKFDGRPFYPEEIVEKLGIV